MHLILIHAAAAARATVRQVEAAAVHYLCCTGIISPCLSLSHPQIHTHTRANYARLTTAAFAFHGAVAACCL